MGRPIQQIEGIGPAFAEKLAGEGVRSVEGLLERGATARGREVLAKSCDIPEASVLRWVNHADLCRIRGVGGEFAELLEAGGVDTVKELRNRSAENLAMRLAAVNAEKSLTRRVPSARVVNDWIEQAKQLPAKVEH